MIYILTNQKFDIYFMVYIIFYGGTMESAKLFVNGRSQAVRLPKAFRFEGNEVYIKKVSGGVLLIPKDRSMWDIWEQNLLKYEEPFMAGRNQPEMQDKRAGLDEIST
jgi:antitoxin VapB